MTAVLVDVSATRTRTRHALGCTCDQDTVGYSAVEKTTDPLSLSFFVEEDRGALLVLLGTRHMDEEEKKIQRQWEGSGSNHRSHLHISTVVGKQQTNCGSVPLRGFTSCRQEVVVAVQLQVPRSHERRKRCCLGCSQSSSSLPTYFTMMTPSVLVVALLAVSVAAFAPHTSRSSTKSFGRFMFGTDQDGATTAVDTFEAYAIATENQQLAIKDLVVGTGDGAKDGDIIAVTYEGRLMTTGKRFDKGEFALKLGSGQVMPGWEKGLQGVQAGGTRVLRIPPDLGYGAKGAGATIPPNADLEFEVVVKTVKSGPLADFELKTGFGVNAKTIGLTLLLVLSVVLPRLGIGEKGFF